MQAIVTKYHGPTNVRGSRYSARCQRGSIYFSADDALSPEDNHVAAAKALCDKFAQADTAKYGTLRILNPWQRPFVSGGLPDGSYAHVFLPLDGVASGKPVKI